MQRMKASDMVVAICDALNRKHAPSFQGGSVEPLENPPGAYVTALIAPQGGEVELDRHQLANLGIRFASVCCLCATLHLCQWRSALLCCTRRISIH